MMRKRWIAIALAAVLLLPTMATTSVFAKTSVKPEQEGLLTALGFLTTLRTTDGSYDYERKITRAEFTAEVMNFQQYEQISTKTSYFIDVSGNTYESAINRAAECGVVLGYGAGRFQPEQNITLEEAVRLLGRVLGYQWLELSDNTDLKPVYQGLVTKLELTDNVRPDDAYLSGADMALLLYNTLNANLSGMQGSVDSFQITISEETILTQYYGIYETTGVLMGTEKTALSSADTLSKGYIRIDGELYRTEADYNEYLGSQVKLYYREEDGEKNVLYLWALENKMDILQIDASEVVSYATNELRYTTDNSRRVEKADVSLAANVIYNGRYTKDYTDADFTPTYGSIKLIDRERDGLYETVIITAIEYYVVEQIRTVDNVIVDKYGKPDLNMMVEGAGEIKEILYNGRAAELSYIQTNDALAVTASKDQTLISVSLVTQKVTGTVNEISDDEIKIEGELYPYETGIVEMPSVGDSGKFYLDGNGHVVICVLDGVSAQYGYALRVGMDARNQHMMLRILKEDGTFEDFSTAAKVKYVNCDLAETKSLSGSKLYQDYFKSYGSDPVGLIMYETNEEGDIKTILRYRDNASKSAEEQKSDPGYDTSVDFSRDTIMTGMRIYESAFASIRYQFDASTKVFIIPTGKEVDNEDMYTAGTMALLSGDIRNLTVEGYNANEGKNLGAMVVHWNKSGGTASNTMYVNNTFVISKVSRQVDENGEEALAITGYQDGVQKKLIFAEEDLQSFASNFPGSNKRANELGFGDVIGYTLNGANKIDSFVVIFHWSSMKDTPEAWYEAGNDLAVATSERAIANCHTIYGKVKTNKANAVVLNGHDDATDNTWDRVFSYTATAVYLVDTEEQTITVADEADAMVGDAVFIRDRLCKMNLMLIYR